MYKLNKKEKEERQFSTRSLSNKCVNTRSGFLLLQKSIPLFFYYQLGVLSYIIVLLWDSAEFEEVSVPNRISPVWYSCLYVIHILQQVLKTTSNATGVLSMLNKYLCYFTVSHILTTLNNRSHLLLVAVTEKLAPDTLQSHWQDGSASSCRS